MVFSAHTEGDCVSASEWCSVHTLNRQLEDRGLQFTEYDNKLIGLVAKVREHGFMLQNELGKLRELELGQKYANIKMELIF